MMKEPFASPVGISTVILRGVHEATVLDETTCQNEGSKPGPRLLEHVWGSITSVPREPGS